MRLSEIDGKDPAGQRVKMMRDNAKRAKEQADRLKNRAVPMDWDEQRQLLGMH